MMTENGLWYVTNFLTMHDMFRLTSTCHFLNNDKDIWMYFCFYYKQRLNQSNKNYFNKLKYWINLQNRNSKLYLSNQLNSHFASSISNKFKTEIGGTLHFDSKVYHNVVPTNSLIRYFKRLCSDVEYEKSKLERPIFTKRNIFKIPLQFTLGSIIWLPEETYKLNCHKNLLFVEHGSFSWYFFQKFAKLEL